MDTALRILGLLLLVAAFFNLRMTFHHLSNLVGYKRRVNESLSNLERGELPRYPFALAAHLERAAEKGPRAVTERVRWDWVGFVAFGLATSAGLIGLGVFLLVT